MTMLPFFLLKQKWEKFMSMTDFMMAVLNRKIAIMIWDKKILL